VVALPVVECIPQVDKQCSETVLPKCAPWFPLGSATSFQGTLEYVSVMATLKYTYFFLIKGAVVCKNNRGTSLIDDIFHKTVMISN
jgi:hypothetical protein